MMKRYFTIIMYYAEWLKADFLTQNKSYNESETLHSAEFPIFLCESFANKKKNVKM